MYFHHWLKRTTLLYAEILAKEKNQLNIFITKVVLAKTMPVSQQTIPIYRTTSDNIRQYGGGGIGNTMTLRKMINERNVYQEDGYVELKMGRYKGWGVEWSSRNDLFKPNRKSEYIKQYKMVILFLFF